MDYPIGDLVIRIKNGYMARKDIIDAPYSVFKENLLKRLVDLKYIKDFKVEGDIKKVFTIELLYSDGVPALTDVKIFSTPGRRYYTNSKKLKPVLGGLGVALVSTSKGILTNKEAKEKQIGGELLFHIW